MAQFTIIPWDQRYHQDLIDLSVAWLEKFDLLEPADWILLNDPQAVLQDGGQIFFARDADAQIVGTASAVNNGDGSFELAKLTVREDCRHHGIGQALVEQVLDFVRSRGGKSVVLYSNRKLIAALRLYHRLGFQDAPHENSKYEVSDIKMVYPL